MSTSNNESRESHVLDGQWEFITDPKNVGLENDWMEPDTSWPERRRSVEVPTAWEEYDEYRKYSGKSWYRRSITLPEQPLTSQDVFLRFGAVDYQTSVWINGHSIGTNRGGFLPFEFDITDAVEAGENTVVVSVTDPIDTSEYPHGKQGNPWYTQVSGIWQSVSIEYRPRNRVKGLKVTPNWDSDTVTVECDIRAETYDYEDLHAQIDLLFDGATVATTTVPGQESLTADFELESPEYWRPQNPVLYDIEIKLRTSDTVLDKITDYFGFRSLDTDGERFLLNGQEITLRGVLDQGYYPETLYRPPNEHTFNDEIATAKELGFNLIRKHLKPAHPDFLEQADKQGILVWEETANPTIYSEYSREAVQQQMHQMVERDYNRPSVVIWSLYNEEWGIGHADGEESLWTDEDKQRFLAEQYRVLRRKDSSRLVCDNSGWAHVRTDINDFHRYFVSPDRGMEWKQNLDHLSAHPDDNWATRQFDSTSAPLVLSELGTWGLSNLSRIRGDSDDDDPHWFHHEFLTDPLKRPAQVDTRFANTDLSTIFDDYESLARSWQRRQFCSLKHILGEIRKRTSISGYILTQLADTEWEFNGILDNYRESKIFYDRLKSINKAVGVIVSPEQHATWSDTPVSVDVTVVNDTRRDITASVHWSYADQQGTYHLDVEAHNDRVINEEVIPPGGDEVDVRTDRISVTLETDDFERETSTPLTTIRSAGMDPFDLTIFAEGGLASRLAGEEIAVTHRIEKADMAATHQMTQNLLEFANRGGAVIHIPRDDTVDGITPFEYYQIPSGESWAATASFLYQDSPLFEGLCEGHRLGWSFERLFPDWAATDLDPTEDVIHIGYVEGWLSNWSSPVVTRPYGEGSVTACTLQLRDTYSDHPTATLFMNRLLKYLDRSSTLSQLTD